MPNEEKKPPMAESSARPNPAGMPKVLPIKFIHEKSSQYRIVHGDGVWGSINAIGNAQLDFFVERAITPNAIVQPVDAEGNFSGEQKAYGMVDPEYILVIREMQVGVVLSYLAAVQVHAVLGNYLEATKPQMDAALEQMKKPQ